MTAYNSHANRNWQESADSEYDGVPVGSQVVPNLPQIENTPVPVEDLLYRKIDEEVRLSPSPQIIPGSTDIRVKNALMPSRRGKRAINQGLKDLRSRVSKRIESETSFLPTVSEAQVSSKVMPSSSVDSELTQLAVMVANLKSV